MRFSLISLLGITGLIAIVCCIFFALPDVVSLIVLVAITMSVIPAASISGIVFGRGKTRAFWIGVLASSGWIVPLIAFYSVLGGLGGGLDEEEAIWFYKAFFAIIYATSAACGSIAMGVRWLCQRGTNVANVATPQPQPTIMVIDPRDKAELYAILQGRMGNGAALMPAQAEEFAAASNGSGG